MICSPRILTRVTLFHAVILVLVVIVFAKIATEHGHGDALRAGVRQGSYAGATQNSVGSGASP